VRERGIAGPGRRPGATKSKSGATKSKPGATKSKSSRNEIKAPRNEIKIAFPVGDREFSKGCARFLVSPSPLPSMGVAAVLLSLGGDVLRRPQNKQRTPAEPVCQ
jgi:hypothetical protein